MRDESKQSRGCGFVKFSNKEMAASAINALHENYTMRGCNQPLIVRFADPKRPRPDPRGGSAFGGGFGHRSEDSTVIRPQSNFDESMGGRLPPNEWGPVSAQTNGPSSLARTHGFGSNSSTKGGAVETPSPGEGIFEDTGGAASGSQSSHSAASLSQKGFDTAQINPVSGQQMPPLQKTLIPPHHLPPSLQLHNNQQILAPHPQGQVLQAPMQQLGQLQVPHSIGLPSNQTVLPQQLPGMGGQLFASQPFMQHNASAAGMQTQFGLQHQGMAAVANQQQLPGSISHQLFQYPAYQLPSQFPQVLLQQQAQALQSSFQSSQQALFQLQQQVQLMQQSGLSQQNLSQNAKQQSTWTGPFTTSSAPVSTPAVSATPLPLSTTSAVPLTCNWTEHTSPQGFKYYYNSVTQESKWEKPKELLIFEQQQQQKLAVQQLQSPAQTTSHSQVQPTQPVPQTQQVQAQMQLRQQAQFQLQPSADFNYAQLQAVGSVTDPARLQQNSMQGQGVKAAPELSYQNKPAGS
ncbi:flowering time control protein FCA-like [Iris pallida]|uniref:Flowering time control protein FCA-like n=1 Tax=Iris pallida TaxID=29817 RepID=A0AAX6EUY0_IRIPA|nr:flowering time control protein FCA-like [Iris pallida]